MSIIINNIKLKFSEPKEEAINKALKILGLSASEVTSVGIVKSSLDARKRTDITTVHSVCVKLNTDEQITVNKIANNDVVFREDLKTEFKTGKEPLKTRPYIIGFGPCGMFTALVMARMGYKPIVLERGMKIEQRVDAVNSFWAGNELNVKGNVQFGEGGAGTFSDGKLTTRIKDPLSNFVLEEFVAHGAPKDILYKAKPHIGTDLLRNIVKSIREEIISLGAEINFDTPLEDVDTNGGAITKIKYNNQWYESDIVILSLGHSARDTFEMLHNKGIAIENKPFSIGLRIEHLQSELDKALYGDKAGHPLLPKGEYQLSYKENGRGVYTFCMCPGGTVVPSSSEEGTIVTNGMSEYLRDGKNANSAIAVSVDENDLGKEWDSGINFQRKLEQSAYNISKSYKAPCQTVGNFLSNKKGCNFDKVIPSYSIGTVDADFNVLLPNQISALIQTGIRVFNTKIKGFSASDSVLTGVETRTSSPVRITRDENTKQSINTKGLYPCGEGAGYAGGIMSAAIDGINTAKVIMEIYKAE